MTIGDDAERSGLDRAVVSRLENGKQDNRTVTTAATGEIFVVTKEAELYLLVKLLSGRNRSKDGTAMTLPTVLVISEDPVWIRAVKDALKTGYTLRHKEGMPQKSDVVLGSENGPPPDIVVWRLENSAHDRLSRCRELMQWALRTKFIIVKPPRNGFWAFLRSLRFPLNLSSRLRTWLAWRSLAKSPLVAFVAAGSPLLEVVECVNQEAAKCWWTQLSELDFPACQLSPSGRILRGNGAMTERFGREIEGTFFRLTIEEVDDGRFPDLHPIGRSLSSGKVCQDFIDCPKGQFQLVCLPDQMGVPSQTTASVLILDVGNRIRMFHFARELGMRDLAQVYQFIVQCAVELGYPRVRLYRLSADRKEFKGVASHGFRDPAKKLAFETNFQLVVDDDTPSADTLDHGIPVLCVIDPNRNERDRRPRLVRHYKHRKFVDELELEGANRWIEAPLVVPSSGHLNPAILGKLVVDRGVDSDQLSIRDALDIGYLAMMGAGAIHALNESKQEAKLLNKEKFLTNLLEVLPLFAFEQDDRRFYRAIAAILSCHAGLRWEQVMLFIVDSSGLKQASCVMALGGMGEPEQYSLRDQLQITFGSLRDYVNDALANPEPDDSLFRTWVQRGGEHHVVSFGHAVAPSGPIQPGAENAPRFIHPYMAEGPVADLLSLRKTNHWLPIDVRNDSWCQHINQQWPSTFAGEQMSAFPLSKSFALDVEFGADIPRTQPVGVVLVSAAGRPGREPQDLHLTRITLDLLGALIAQRWTGRRMRGMFGALSTFHHSKLKGSWERVKREFEQVIRSWSLDVYTNYQGAIKNLDGVVGRIELALATLKNVELAAPDELDLGSFIADNKVRWETEWGNFRTVPRLSLAVDLPQAPIRIACDQLVLADALTCLLSNAIQAAREQNRKLVTVQISARVFQDRFDFVEITVEDDAGGVNPAIEPYLFVKGVSGQSRGQGRGLALARAELLMYSGDLQYVSSREAHGATFRILFLQGDSHAPSRPAEAHVAAR